MAGIVVGGGVPKPALSEQVLSERAYRILVTGQVTRERADRQAVARCVTCYVRCCFAGGFAQLGRSERFQQTARLGIDGRSKQRPRVDWIAPIATEKNSRHQYRVDEIKE